MYTKFQIDPVKALKADYTNLLLKCVTVATKVCDGQMDREKDNAPLNIMMWE